MKIKAETINGDIVEISQKELSWRISVYGILVENAHILLLKNVHNKDDLFLPGGEVEIHENVTQALKREFFEETGIDIESTELVYHRENIFKGPRYGAFHSFQLFFIVKQKGENRNKIVDKHVKDIRWYPLSLISSLSLAPQINFLNNARVLDLIR